MHPAHINQRIAEYSDWNQTPDAIARQELLGLWKDYRNQFSDVNLATFVFRSACRKLFRADEPVVAELAARAQRLIGPSTRPRAIASAASGFAQIGHRDVKTWDVICAAATQRMEDFSARELDQLTHAVGSRGRREPSLLHAAALAVARCASSFDCQQLCSVAWFCARTMPASELSNIGQRLSQAAKASADRFSVKQIGYLLKSFGVMRHHDVDMQVRLVGRLREGLDNMSNKEVAIALAGMVSVDHWDMPLIDRMAERVARAASRNRLRHDEIAHLTESFAKVATQMDGFGALMSDLARCARDRVDELTPREVVHIADSRARYRFFDPTLFDELCARALRSERDFYASQLIGLHWACAKLRYRDAAWLQGVSAAIRRRGEQLFAPMPMAKLAVSMAELWHDDRDLLEVLVAAMKGCLARFNDQEIANVAWSMAVLAHPDDELAGRLSEAANAKWRDFHEFGLVQLHQAALAWPLRLDDALQRRIAATLQRMQELAKPDANEFESRLSGALSRLGIPHEMQKFEEGYFADICCEVDGVRYDIECDGERFHYFLDRDGQRHGLVGGNRLRDRIFKDKGYAVLRVVDREWSALLGSEAQDRWLRARLAR